MQTKLVNIKEELKQDKEKASFFVLLFVMAGYYAWRMFALTPWYDELYTYYYFISRGPVYAAIHWPVPNNHVGYSVLSAFLDFFGNAYIGLRGISYICALCNLVLLYRISKKWLDRGFTLIPVVLYLSMKLVNNLAVQGRGYTLSTTCFLFALWQLCRICEEEEEKRKPYIFFALSLVLALYAVPSNVYFVIPLCISGGLVLLLQKKRGRLVRLIVYSIAAALMTCFLYALIWLAIGSNLLVKEEGGSFYGMSHGRMILKAPFAALKAGMDYMLATPYIQSVERKGFFSKLFGWCRNLLNWYYDGLWLVLLVLVMTGILLLILRIRHQMDVISMTVVICEIAIPTFLIVQSKLPYYRVFSYGGVLLALSISYLLKKILQGKKQMLLCNGLIMLFVLSRFFFYGYQDQYGMREYYIQDGLKKSSAAYAEDIRVTDCTEQYLIKFLYGQEVENTEIDGAGYLLLDHNMLDPDYSEMEWEFYHYYNTIPWEYVDQNMTKVYENEQFTAFVRNGNK